jgi:hypothetical protein
MSGVRPPIDALARLRRDVAMGTPADADLLTFDGSITKWKNGAGGGGAGVSRIITQTAHGFVVSNVLQISGTLYALAQANAAPNAESVGIVSQIVSADKFVLVSAGWVPGLSGLVADSVYFLSDTVAGALTLTEPTTPGAVSKPLLISDSTTSGYFFNFRGMIIPSTTAPSQLFVGTDMRFTAITGGGILECRNPSTGNWVTADQWTNP